MEVQAESDREFWRGALLAGGFTAIPRWTHDPVPGIAEHGARIPDDRRGATASLADELAVPFSSVLLAAHAKVLAALSGEREVTTGYLAVQGGQPLPCRADDRTRLMADDAAGDPSGRVRSAVAQGLPGR